METELALVRKFFGGRDLSFMKNVSAHHKVDPSDEPKYQDKIKEEIRNIKDAALDYFAEIEAIAAVNRQLSATFDFDFEIDPARMETAAFQIFLLKVVLRKLRALQLSDDIINAYMKRTVENFSLVSGMSNKNIYGRADKTTDLLSALGKSQNLPETEQAQGGIVTVTKKQRESIDRKFHANMD